MGAWTLSGFADEIHAEPAIQCAVLAALGASHIEVRSAWDTNVVDWDSRRLELFREAVRSAGFAVSAIASPIGKSPALDAPEFELGRLGRAIAAAHALGAHYIRVFSFSFDGPGPSPAVRDAVLHRLSSMARIAERSGIVLLHENEKNIYGDTPERILDVIESVGSDALRVAWDSANFVQVGVRPFSDAYPLLREHIAYVQVKDASASTGLATPAGHGDGELIETLTALRDDGFAGYVSLEPHLPAPKGSTGFPGPHAFGLAARAFRHLTDSIGVDLL